MLRRDTFWGGLVCREDGGRVLEYACEEFGPFIRSPFREDSIFNSGIKFSRWPVRLLLGMSCLLLAALYSALALVLPHNSDNSTMLLEARSILGGNILLNHWEIPADNFWSLDVPYYVIFSLFLPRDPHLMALVPAFLYACLVVTGVLFVLAASSGQPLFSRTLAALFVGITLGALPPPLLSYVGGDLLTGPNHVCTMWYLLLLLWLRARVPDPDPSLSGFGVVREIFSGSGIFAVILWSLLLIGDPFSVTLGVIPFLGVDFLLAWRRKGEWSRFWLTLYTILTAVLVAKLFAFLRFLIGFHLAWKLNTDFIAFKDLPGHVGDVFRGLLNSYGGNIFGHSLVVADTWVRLIRAVLLGSTLIVSVGTLWKAFAPEDGSREKKEKSNSLPVLLSAILFLDLAAVLLSQNAHNNGEDGVNRFLLPVAIFGPILLGERIHFLLEGLRTDRIGRVFLLGMAALGMVGALAECIGGWGVELTALRKSPDRVVTVPGTFENPFEKDQKRVVAWLEKNDLRNGYAQYWNALIVSVMTRSTVTVAPVTFSKGRFRPNPIFISFETYREIKGKAPAFLITGSAGVDGVSRDNARRVFGSPDLDREIGRYHVLVWKHGVRLFLPGKNQRSGR